MSAGRLIAVVGSSGVGKDSVMAGLAAALPSLALVRRIITRPPGLAGEDYEAVSDAEFRRLAAEGAFCLHWRAHELRYGIPAETLDAVRSGAQRMANLSRSALEEAAAIFPSLTVLNISASPEILAQRLARRGRETAEVIAERLDRASRPLPDGLHVIEIDNTGPLAGTVEQAARALQPVRT